MGWAEEWGLAGTFIVYMDIISHHVWDLQLIFILKA